MNEISNLETVNNILPGVELPDFQRKGIASVFANNRMLLGFDTGTGKTFTCAGIIRGLLNRNPDKKHLLVVINDSIPQVPKDIAKLTGVRVEYFDGTVESAGNLKRLWSRTSVIVLTLNAFRVRTVINVLFSRLPEIESLTIDEAHHCSNWDESDTAFMIRSFAQYIPYVIELTATPMTRESKQYYRLMNLLDRNMSMHRDETFLGKYVDRYMPVNRSEYEMRGDYTPTIIRVKPMLNQIGRQHGIIFKKLKGTGAKPQAEALVENVLSRLANGKRIIVYVHYHDSRLWIEQHLREAGIQFVSIHGRVRKRSEREDLLDLYKSGNVNVVVTSVTESLNIDADVVIFYEFTTLVKQVIGRAHRGLNPKPLEIAFVITENSAEVEFFLEYIYERSLTIQRLLKKDYSELVAIGEQLKSLSLAED